ncbi:MAG: hypothetical protein OXR66_07270 [Candidatus Woesearchaeota archaeon]|nr:hypothetical protein [Candidatus Woesearchaeota archaeon]
MHYSFSYTTESREHALTEEPVLTPETVPLDIFSHGSTMQVLSRYLVDKQQYSFTKAAELLQRSPKTIWASYHQTEELPDIKDSLPIPLSIFSQGLSPLEALVSYLQSLGMKNAAIARALHLSPKTTHTAAKRAEVKQ